MKKMFFVLTALAMPLTAHAEEIQLAPKTMPEATVQAAIKEFGDIGCQAGFQDLIHNVQQCIKETSEDSPNIDKCIIGHYVLLRETNLLRKISAERGEEDPTNNIPYIKPKVSHDRGIHYIHLPRYKNVEFSDYFMAAVNTVFQKLQNTLTKCSSN